MEWKEGTTFIVLSFTVTKVYTLSVQDLSHRKRVTRKSYQSKRTQFCFFPVLET